MHNLRLPSRAVQPHARRSTSSSSASCRAPAPPQAEASTDVGLAAAEADANSWHQGPREKRAENVAGTFWVDSACIDCDTCR
jgi:hypothetical protein